MLIHGPSGIGKTKLVHQVLSDLDLLSSNSFLVHPKDLFLEKPKSDKGERTNLIKSLFEAAQKLRVGSPHNLGVIVIEDIDLICKGQELLYTLMDEIDQMGSRNRPLLVIATSSSLEKVDKGLRRGGRLDLDIRMDMPTDLDRFLIFKEHLNRLAHSVEDEDLKMMARASSGFVSADIAQIIRNCHLRAVQQDADSITKEILEAQILESKPLSIQDMLVEVPRVLWSEIGGNEEIKFQVKQCVEWPLKYPEKFELLGLKPPQGIMLHGPPGCSKTMIAKALATESGLNFLAIKGPELFSKYVGDTEKAIREIFRKARLSAPSIIFFDEIDAMATQRGGDETSVSDRALCQLLNEMDGVESRAKVIVVAATNRLDIIDSALLRPGRFDRLIKVPLPDQKARK